MHTRTHDTVANTLVATLCGELRSTSGILACPAVSAGRRKAEAAAEADHRCGGQDTAVHWREGRHGLTDLPRPYSERDPDRGDR